MFETLPNPSLDVVLIAGRAIMLIGALCVFALAFIRWRRADEQNSQRLQDQLERAFMEVRSLHETVSVMSARLEGLSERAEVGASLAPAGLTSQRGYDVATRLAKNGADAEDLIANCGVTRHEAELLVRLHGTKKRQGPEGASSRRRPEAELASALRQHQRTSARSAGPQPDGVLQSRAPNGKRGSLLSVVG